MTNRKTSLIFVVAALVFLGNSLFAQDNKKIFSGKTSIIKSVVYYKDLKIDKNASMKYPKFYLPIVFLVKKMRIEENPKIVRLYAWKFLRINDLNISAKKIFIDTGAGSIYLDGIKTDANPLEITIGEYTKTVFLKTGGLKSKKINILILNGKKQQKYVVIDNKKGSFLNLKCSSDGIASLVYYRGPADKLKQNGKCKVLLSSCDEWGKSLTEEYAEEKNKKTLQEYFYENVSKNVKDALENMYNKYAWIPEKNLIYFIKYVKNDNGKGFIGSVFAVDLKTNKVIRSVPKEILKKAGCKTIR